jgi:surfeit locus 1 family protein
MAYCPLTDAPWGGIVLDRGLVDRFAGRMSPAEQVFPPPVWVVGVIRSPGTRGLLDAPPIRSADGALVLQSVDPAALKSIAGRGVAPYYLAVESETPAPLGVTPAALPQDIPNNHFVYALTWFGMAGVLASVWASYVWRRMRAP